MTTKSYHDMVREAKTRVAEVTAGETHADHAARSRTRS